MNLTNEHEKLIIYSFKDKKALENVQKDESKKFVVQINPKNVGKNFNFNHIQNSNIGNNAKESQFFNIEPITHNLEILLDGTGAFSMNPNKSLSSLSFAEKGKNENYVSDKIQELEQTVSEYNGDTHRPPFVGINWRGELFKGIVLSKEIKYTLFSNNGLPLQATISLTIREYQCQKKQEQKNKNNSPDLTHVRITKQGDNIMTLTNEIYGDPKYYQEVVRVNKIINFRNLKAGTKLFFPPFEKATA